MHSSPLWNAWPGPPSRSVPCLQDFARLAEVQFLDNLRRGASINYADLQPNPVPANLAEAYRLLTIISPQVSSPCRASQAGAGWALRCAPCQAGVAGAAGRWGKLRKQVDGRSCASLGRGGAHCSGANSQPFPRYFSLTCGFSMHRLPL